MRRSKKIFGAGSFGDEYTKRTVGNNVIAYIVTISDWEIPETKYEVFKGKWEI